MDGVSRIHRERPKSAKNREMTQRKENGIRGSQGRKSEWPRAGRYSVDPGQCKGTECPVLRSGSGPTDGSKLREDGAALAPRGWGCSLAQPPWRAIRGTSVRAGPLSPRPQPLRRAALTRMFPAAQAERETEKSLDVTRFGIPWTTTRQRKCTTWSFVRRQDFSK